MSELKVSVPPELLSRAVDVVSPVHDEIYLEFQKGKDPGDDPVAVLRMRNADNTLAVSAELKHEALIVEAEGTMSLDVKKLQEVLNKFNALGASMIDIIEDSKFVFRDNKGNRASLVPRKINEDFVNNKILPSLNEDGVIMWRAKSGGKVDETKTVESSTVVRMESAMLKPLNFDLKISESNLIGFKVEGDKIRSFTEKDSNESSSLLDDVTVKGEDASIVLDRSFMRLASILGGFTLQVQSGRNLAFLVEQEKKEQIIYAMVMPKRED